MLMLMLMLLLNFIPPNRKRSSLKRCCGRRSGKNWSDGLRVQRRRCRPLVFGRTSELWFENRVDEKINGGVFRAHIPSEQMRRAGNAKCGFAIP